MKSLRAELLLWFVLISTVVLALMGAFNYWQERAKLYARLEEQKTQILQRMEQTLPEAMYNYQAADIARSLESEMNNPNVASIYVRMEDGEPIALGRDEEDWKSVAIEQPPAGEPDAAQDFQKKIFGEIIPLGAVEIYMDDRLVRNQLSGILSGVIWQIVILNAVLLVAVSILLQRVLIAPLHDIRNTLADVAQTRDCSLRPQKRKGNEIGEVCDSVNALLDGIEQKAQLAETIAGGDLTVDATPASARDTLGLALQRMVGALTKIIGQVSVSSDRVTEGAQQINSSSNSLSNGAMSQAASIEQISSSMTQISQQTKTNAENADQANTLVGAVRDSALRGNSQMKEMMEAMEKIISSSQEISKIIKVIDDIAFQTNLLALNAAVEAARAGRHGKGFAVVAEEVRNLAARSAKAANETSGLIEESIQRVQNGNEIANRTASALEEIEASVGEAANLVSEIAAASNEQAQGIGQVNEGLAQIDEVTQRNTATAEETASASQELSGRARELQGILTRFRLRDEIRQQFHAGQIMDSGVYASLPAPTPTPPTPQPPAPAGAWGQAAEAQETIALDDRDFGKY